MFATEDVAPSERVSLWSHQASTLFPLADYDCANASEFEGRLSWRRWGRVQLCDIVAAPQVVRRKARHVAQDPDDVYEINLQIEGEGGIEQGGRLARMQAGHFIVSDGMRPYEMTFERPFRQLSIKILKHDLDPEGRLTEGVLCRALDGTDGVGSLLFPFLQACAALGADEGRMGGRLQAQITGLVSSALVEAAGEDLTAPLEAGHPLRTLRRIQRGVLDCLSDPELGPAEIAAANGISVRHLHTLFAREGVSVGRWLLARRLERCRLNLVDPGQRHVPVGVIAGRWGLLCAAHFSRAFRAAYGMSPREMRRRHVGRA